MSGIMFSHSVIKEISEALGSYISPLRDPENALDNLMYNKQLRQYGAPEDFNSKLVELQEGLAAAAKTNSRNVFLSEDLVGLAHECRENIEAIYASHIYGRDYATEAGMATIELAYMVDAKLRSVRSRFNVIAAKIAPETELAKA